jgi:hypothetical protein
MRRQYLIATLVAALPVLGACASVAEPIDLAEATTRCEQRGGTLEPTGRQTGEVRRDHRCVEALVQVRHHRAQATRNTGIDRALNQPR